MSERRDETELEARMSNRTKLGLNILGAALLLGVLGDALLRETPWGLNVPLWTGAAAAVAATG